MLCLIRRIHDGKMYFAVTGRMLLKIELLPYHPQQQQQQQQQQNRQGLQIKIQKIKKKRERD